MFIRSRNTRVAGLLAILLSASSFLVTPGPIRAAGQDALTFGSDMDPTATFGANDIIRIDGRITFKDDCPKDEGISDWVYPATDVYIVAPDSVTDGAKLTDVGGGRPNTIVSGASVFTDEVIGVTAPTGDIDEGTYDVVYDTCQDGKYNAGVDTVFPHAITVTLPDILPLANEAITRMKQEAAIDYVSWLASKFAMNKIFEQADKAIKVECELGNAIGCAMKKLDYFDGIKKNVLALMLSEANHFLAIAMDPPDADYKHVASVGPIAILSDHTDSPVSNATADTVLPMAAESAVSDALLHAVERYQGAVAAGDGPWALEHAREARNLAVQLSQLEGATSSAIGALRDAMAADPDLGQAVSAGGAFAHRVWSSGFTADERRTLLNTGMTATQVAALETDVRSEGASLLSLQDILDRLDETLSAHAATASAAADEATLWAGVVGQIEADPSITAAGPGADAGGPYTAAEGESITLQGSAPGPIDAAAWDLDADGSFDDATGLHPDVSIPTAGAHLVGLRVTSGNAVSVAYAVVTVSDTAHAPQISNPVPTDRAATITVGASQAFSVSASDPDGNPLGFAWTVDGNAVAASGDTFTWTPSLSDVGTHTVQVVVDDGTPGGGTTRRSWDAVVLAPDADNDGWTQTTDCDETDPAVHPTANELLGNGIDDDCDPGTPDAPPGGLTGSMQSWGSNHNGTVGTGSWSPVLVDTPVAIPGYDNVVQLKSAFRVGYAVLDDGEVRGWGTNLTGELGTGTCCTATATPVSPLTVGGGPGNLTGVTEISANGGNIHVVARRADGTVVSWGDNQQHQMGDGSTVNYRSYPVETLSEAGGAPLSGVHAVEAGAAESYALMDDGTVKAWGQIRCDGGSTIHVEPYPITLGLVGGDVKQISSGNQWTLFLKKDGTVLECGYVPPVAGRPVTYADMYQPLPVTGFGPGSGVIDIAAGMEAGLALKSDGTVWTWGQNNNGELNVVGAPGGTGVPAPVQVPLPPGPPVVDVDMSNACEALVLRADGSALGWGCDVFEQVGDGPHGLNTITDTPQVLSMPGLAGVAVSNSDWNGMVLVRPADDTSWDRPATWVDASVADASMSEAGGGSFDVSLSAALPQDVTVDWALEAGTAGADDLDLATGTVTIPAGETTAQVPVSVTDDAIDEDAETFTIVLSNTSNGIGLARPEATGTIVDNDAAPSVSIEGATVDEGDTGLTDAPVRIHLSHASSRPVTVSYSTADAGATAPGDYTAALGIVVIPAGSDEAFVHLGVHGDSTVEPDEDLTVSLSDPQNATLGDATGTVTIADDEPLVLDVTSPEVTEGDSGTTPATFTVELQPAPPAGSTVTVTYGLEGLDATVPDDVASASGTMTFGPGDGPKTVTVDVVGDTVAEGNESFRLTLHGVATDGRTILAGDNAPATIVDDDVEATPTPTPTPTPPPPAPNQPPTVDAGPDQAGVEGDAISLDGSASDPDAGDTLTSAWTYQAGGDVDAGASCAFGDANAVGTTISCTDDGTYTVTLTVDDGQGHTAADTATVTVGNAAPQVQVTKPLAFVTVSVGSNVTVAAAVSDPGANDTLGCEIDWGDGTVEAATPANGACGGSHAYATIGVPTITVTATDDDGDSGSDDVALVVAAPATKVSGGGWIEPDGTRTSFGFVATPDGDTFTGEIQVNTGKHRFHGHVVESLVTSGSSATWSGTGRWDGDEGFTYVVSVQDLRNGGGKKGSPDTFSIEVRDASGTVVLSVAGPLGGGNLKVG